MSQTSWNLEHSPRLPRVVAWAVLLANGNSLEARRTHIITSMTAHSGQPPAAQVLAAAAAAATRRVGFFPSSRSANSQKRDRDLDGMFKRSLSGRIVRFRAEGCALSQGPGRVSVCRFRPGPVPRTRANRRSVAVSGQGALLRGSIQAKLMSG